MAIKVTKTFQKPSADIAWYKQTDETATHIANEYDNNGVRAFIASPDALTLVVTRFFDSEARYEQFITDSVMIVERINRANYNLENGIDESPAVTEEVEFDFTAPSVTMTKTFSRTSDSVEFYKMDETTLAHYRNLYINTAKAYSPARVVSEDGLTLTVTQRFQTEADYQEFMADPVIVASADARTAYNTANNITEVSTVVS